MLSAGGIMGDKKTSFIGKKAGNYKANLAGYW